MFTGADALPALAEGSVEITSNEPGVGAHPAGGRDLLLVHYVGKLLFDLTLSTYAMLVMLFESVLDFMKASMCARFAPVGILCS